MSTTLAFLGEFGDAIDYIFHVARVAGGRRAGRRLGELLPLLWTHLKVTALAMAIAIADRAAARARARPHRPRRVRHDLGLERRPRRPERRADRVLRRVLPGARRSSGTSPWRSRCSRSRRSSPTPTSASGRSSRDTVDAARGMGMSGVQIVRSRRAPARAAADLRRHQDLDRQRHRHRHDRAARRRAHARRPDHLRLRLRARRADRRVDRGRRARRRRRAGPVAPSSGRSRPPASSSKGASARSRLGTLKRRIQTVP